MFLQGRTDMEQEEEEVEEEEEDRGGYEEEEGKKLHLDFITYSTLQK